MRSPSCPECQRLEAEVIVALQSLRELTSAQLDAFKIFDLNQFMRLDMELENAVGDKERKIGALHQHQREHDDAQLASGE